MTESILSLTESINGRYGYLVLCLCAFIENIVPPIPGDTVTIFGGYLTGIGRLGLPGVVLSTTLGSFAGFMLMFYLGRILGRKYFFERDLFFFSRNNLLKACGWFEKYGYTIVFCNRFLSGTRSVISICAGITKLNAAKVAAFTLVSCFVWNLLLVYAGYKAGQNWEVILELLKKYNLIVLLAVALAVVAYAIRKIRKQNPKKQTR
jgi:membrane protein DedA with SNARE-associated domain